MNRSWRVGRIGGVDIRVDLSFFVVAFLLVSYQWTAFSDRSLHPGNGTTEALALSLMVAAVFFGSVLAHEYAHAVMYRVLGIDVAAITLWMFGGFTQAKRAAPTSAGEFAVSAVGPATSAAVGGLLLVAGHALVGQVGDAFVRLGQLNLLLAVFNILPGYPLDGGHVLRSIVWRVTGNPGLATTVAARIGQGFGLVLVAVGVSLGLPTGDLSRLWLAVIGVMLFQTATATLGQERRNRALAETRVGQVMFAPPPSLPADLPLGQALETRLNGHAGEAFPVMGDGHVIGLISLSTAAGVSPDRPVRDATVDPGTTVEARPDEALTDLAARLGDRPASAVLVVEDGRLVGVVEPGDLERFFRRVR